VAELLQATIDVPAFVARQHPGLAVRWLTAKHWARQNLRVFAKRGVSSIASAALPQFVLLAFPASLAAAS
jgi:hypothetical protein